MKWTNAKCSPSPQDELHGFAIYKVAIKHDNLRGSVSEITSPTTYYTFPGRNRNQSARATLLRAVTGITLFVHALSDSVLPNVSVFNTKRHASNKIKLFASALTNVSVDNITNLHASKLLALRFSPKLPIP